MPYQNSAAENVFGIIGTICWTGQLIPQVWKNYHDKKTTGLSHCLMFLWGVSAVLLGVYALLQRLNIPLIVQPQLFGFLCLVSWGQCQYYGARRSRWVATAITVSVIVLFGLLEFILVILLRPLHDRGEHAATTATKALGIAVSALISVALFPQYWQIYKHKEVIGISLVFIAVDMMGGIFNDLSLAFRVEFDAIAAVTYTLVVVLDGIIIIAALILNPKARKRRKLEAQRVDATIAQANATPPLPLTPTMVEVVEGGRRTLEKELGVSSRASPVYKDEERKDEQNDKSSAQLNYLEAGDIERGEVPRRPEEQMSIAAG